MPASPLFLGTWNVQIEPFIEVKPLNKDPVAVDPFKRRRTPYDSLVCQTTEWALLSGCDLCFGAEIHTTSAEIVGITIQKAFGTEEFMEGTWYVVGIVVAVSCCYRDDELG